VRLIRIAEEQYPKHFPGGLSSLPADMRHKMVPEIRTFGPHYLASDSAQQVLLELVSQEEHAAALKRFQRASHSLLMDFNGMRSAATQLFSLLKFEHLTWRRMFMSRVASDATKEYTNESNTYPSWMNRARFTRAVVCTMWALSSADLAHNKKEFTEEHLKKLAKPYLRLLLETKQQDRVHLPKLMDAQLQHMTMKAGNV
jgi:hypothetical protein